MHEIMNKTIHVSCEFLELSSKKRPEKLKVTKEQ